MSRERPGHTLQATALVNEAYLRLAGQDGASPEWQSRAHFYAVAAQVMRRVLIDHARTRARDKRGGPDAVQVTLGEAEALDGGRADDLLALDEALQQLQTLDPQKVKLVELRYFGGLSVEETAEVLGISPTTARREWRRAKAWLYREMSQGDK
jgi:RNA polymerase sigma factor (TIGR02999 family)